MEKLNLILSSEKMEKKPQMSQGRREVQLKDHHMYKTEQPIKGTNHHIDSTTYLKDNMGNWSMTTWREHQQTQKILIGMAQKESRAWKVLLRTKNILLCMYQAA